MWLTAHASHVVARIAVALLPPKAALRATASVVRGLPVGAEAARHIAGLLEPSGTCLTRAVAIAARLEGAQVALGHLRDAGGQPFGHAWVELDGRPLRSWDAHGEVLARFGVESIVLR